MLGLSQTQPEDLVTKLGDDIQTLHEYIKEDRAAIQAELDELTAVEEELETIETTLPLNDPETAKSALSEDTIATIKARLDHISEQTQRAQEKNHEVAQHDGAENTDLRQALQLIESLRAALS